MASIRSCWKWQGRADAMHPNRPRQATRWRVFGYDGNGFGVPGFKACPASPPNVTRFFWTRQASFRVAATIAQLDRRTGRETRDGDGTFRCHTSLLQMVFIAKRKGQMTIQNMQNSVQYTAPFRITSTRGNDANSSSPVDTTAELTVSSKVYFGKKFCSWKYFYNQNNNLVEWYTRCNMLESGILDRVC